MSSSSEIVVVWGEVLWDRFPDGDQLGGAPANLAWHLGQAGGWVRLVTRVGDDADGRRAVAQLDELVDPALVQVDPERATGEVTVRLEGAEGTEPRYTLVPGRAWERIAFTDAVASALEEGIDVFVYGTLAQRTPEGLASWREAVRAARCLRVCDLNLRPTDQPAAAVAEAIAAADVVKVNDRELAALGSWFGWRDPVAALRGGEIPAGAPAYRRDSAGPRTVIVTHGADGSTLYGSGRPIRVAAVPATPGGDNVGCGDAYLAIMVQGLALGADLATSGRLASRWAAAVASVRGATPRFDKARVAELLELP